MLFICFIAERESVTLWCIRSNKTKETFSKRRKKKNVKLNNQVKWNLWKTTTIRTSTQQHNNNCNEKLKVYKKKSLNHETKKYDKPSKQLHDNDISLNMIKRNNGFEIWKKYAHIHISANK